MHLESPKCVLCKKTAGAPPGPHLESLQRSPDLLADLGGSEWGKKTKRERKKGGSSGGKERAATCRSRPWRQRYYAHVTNFINTTAQRQSVSKENKELHAMSLNRFICDLENILQCN